MGKLCLVVAMVAAAMSLSGCCGPMAFGPGCADISCNDCCGTLSETQFIANGPIDALRRARRRMTCGAGCGETYRGEWISTPPDASDPCCGDQFVGGATKCQPYCWQPGNLLRGIYGQRFCNGDASSASCGCEGTCDGGCGATEYVGGEVITSAVAQPSCNCGASHHHAQSHSQIPATRVVAKPAGDVATARQVAQQPKRVRTAKPLQR
jgi:hypothetical protein